MSSGCAPVVESPYPAPVVRMCLSIASRSRLVLCQIAQRRPLARTAAGIDNKTVRPGLLSFSAWSLSLHGHQGVGFRCFSTEFRDWPPDSELGQSGGFGERSLLCNSAARDFLKSRLQPAVPSSHSERAPVRVRKRSSPKCFTSLQAWCIEKDTRIWETDFLGVLHRRVLDSER